MSEAVLNKFIYNDNVYNVSDFDSFYVEITPSVYEVIRVIDNIPLFIEEHYERLLNSAKLIGYSINISLDQVKQTILKMLEINNIDSYNIKIVINNLNSSHENFFYFFTKSNYPSQEMYKDGVKTFLYKGMRENPNAKVLHKSMRDEINKLLEETNYFEALLVNERDEVTEGSRSNLFFVKGDRVYTAPPSDVLLGITRQRIISLCRNNGIDVIETPINVNSLNTYDACFISGTSPKVLPISIIDEIVFSPCNPLLVKIIGIYDDEIQKYINSNK